MTTGKATSRGVGTYRVVVVSKSGTVLATSPWSA